MVQKKRPSLKEALAEDFMELKQYIEKAYSMSRDKNVNLQIEAAKMRMEKIENKLGLN